MLLKRKMLLVNSVSLERKKKKKKEKKEIHLGDFREKLVGAEKRGQSTTP